MNSGDRRSRTKRGIIVAIIVMCLIALIAGTYARYTTTASGSAELSVAKWAVAIKNGDAELSTNQKINFTLVSNDKVVEGKIAPASKAEATVTVDMTGTEVAAKLKAEITKTALETVFGDAADRVALKLTVDETEYASGAEAAIALADVSDVHTVKLTLEWTEDNSATVNEQDTTVGIAAQTITLPVTITATQDI